jgi:hypothetical protein
VPGETACTIPSGRELLEHHQRVGVGENALVDWQFVRRLINPLEKVTDGPPSRRRLSGN